MFLVTIACANGLVALGLMLLLRAGPGVVRPGAVLLPRRLRRRRHRPLLRHQRHLPADARPARLTAGFFAFVLGFLLASYRGIFFGLLSLALSMILYGLLVKSQALGSTDGFNILPSTLFGIRPGPDWVRYAVLASAATVALALALLVHRYLRTPLGPARAGDQGQRDPRRVHGRVGAPRRARQLRDRRRAGRRRRRARRHHRRPYRPEMAFWTTSGEFIFITILAGIGNVLAPFAGALLYGIIHTTAYDLRPTPGR